ncbi:UNVERIFIED_CONTAM: hypothetical protein Sradi_4513500 [Sesamum radiatum]|uniref:Uncharacterized protein n=1 Tax=Sesamum radiatum TaxID=300843 RepID=A0AAW2N8U9_SESRA
MANASGLLSPAVAPSVRRRLNPSIGVFQSGSWFSEGVFRRIVCSSTAQVQRSFPLLNLECPGD